MLAFSFLFCLPCFTLLLLSQVLCRLGSGMQSSAVSERVPPPPAQATAQRVRLECEEGFALQLWAARVRCVGSGAALCAPGDEEESVVAAAQQHGPVLPPGWCIDINDPVLLSYDPYFRSHAAAAEAAAAPLFSAKEGRYYADRALPLCRTGAHSLTSHPPAAVCVEGEGVGSWMQARRVVAQRRFKAGEVVAMDVSELTVVEDSLVWRFFPPPSETYTTRGRNTKTKRNTTNNDNRGSNNGSHVSHRTSPALVAAARQIVLRAHAMQSGEAALVETGYAQFLASLLLLWGDMELLPTYAETREALARLTSSENVPPATRIKALRVSQSAEQMIEKWCAAAADEPNPFLGPLHRTALLLLQCVPPALLSCESKDAARPGGCMSLNSGAELVMPHYGFIRRMQLHRPARLTQLLLAFSRYSTSVQVPDLPMRSGFFPFLRLLPHECRPNCFVMFLDSPASHCYGEAGHFDYNTTGTRIDDEVGVKPVLPWGFPCSDRVFLPSVAVLVACRDIEPGESFSRSLFHSAYMTQPQRSRLSRELYGVSCCCRWCSQEADTARGFRCPQCPRDCGVICPTGDGSRLMEWACMQCGYRPDVGEVERCLDEEKELGTVKADKTIGLVRLLQAKRMHYSHAIVFHKVDVWCQQAWQDRDASMCLEYLDLMQKSVHRVLDPCDPQLAQVHEFTAQINHAVGSAHTARYEYFLALQIRLRAGMRYAHWTRKTWFMAAEKPLTEFLDSV